MISLYTTTIPPLIWGIENLMGIIELARTFATQNSLSESELTTGKLRADMWDFTSQIFAVTYLAQQSVRQITAIEPLEQPMRPQGIESLDSLQERLSKTLKFLEGVDPKVMDGVERSEEKVEVKMPAVVYTMDNPIHFETHWIVPQFWFHVSIAYGILRAKGVDIGKISFMNAANKTNVRKL